jgi:hypothetical protein
MEISFWLKDVTILREKIGACNRFHIPTCSPVTSFCDRLPIVPFFTYSFWKTWNRYLLNFVLENVRKIRLSSFNFLLDLSVLTTTLQKHARCTGFYAHKYSLMSINTRAASLAFNCVTVARKGRNSKNVLSTRFYWQAKYAIELRYAYAY